MVLAIEGMSDKGGGLRAANDWDTEVICVLGAEDGCMGGWARKRRGGAEEYF